MPTKLSLNETGIEFAVDPCAINYKITATPSSYVTQMLNIYLIDVFHCTSIKPGVVILSIVVRNASQMIAEKKEHESYQITIRESDRWELIADCYVGFLRGLETFSQLF
jgi:hypothetical protein